MSGLVTDLTLCKHCREAVGAVSTHSRTWKHNAGFFMVIIILWYLKGK